LDLKCTCGQRTGASGQRIFHVKSPNPEEREAFELAIELAKKEMLTLS